MVTIKVCFCSLCLLPTDSPLNIQTAVHVKFLLQGDSGGKVNILGGDSIDHCEKKSLYGHVSNSELLLR
jgi:hypothetical protein